MMNQEKKVLTISIIVLVCSFILVYIMFFSVKGKDLFGKTTEQGQDSNTNTGVLSQTGVGLVDDILGGETTGDSQTGKNELLIGTKIENKPQTNTGSVSTGTHRRPKEVDIKNIRIFEGTELYSGELAILSELDIDYKYILKSYDDIYFVYLGKILPPIISKVKKLGGNSVEIKDKKVIKENSLFGDEITFLNLPQYQKSKVIVLVRRKSDYWLVQVDYEKYYKLKQSLQEIFNY